MTPPTYATAFKAARAFGASAVEADTIARHLAGGDDPASYRPPSEINDEARAMMMRAK